MLVFCCCCSFRLYSFLACQSMPCSSSSEPLPNISFLKSYLGGAVSSQTGFQLANSKRTRETGCYSEHTHHAERQNAGAAFFLAAAIIVAKPRPAETKRPKQTAREPLFDIASTQERRQGLPCTAGQDSLRRRKQRRRQHQPEREPSAVAEPESRGGAAESMVLSHTTARRPQQGNVYLWWCCCSARKGTDSAAFVGPGGMGDRSGWGVGLRERAANDPRCILSETRRTPSNHVCRRSCSFFLFCGASFRESPLERFPYPFRLTLALPCPRVPPNTRPSAGWLPR